jgi:hypothetical protein
MYAPHFVANTGQVDVGGWRAISGEQLRALPLVEVGASKNLNFDAAPSKFQGRWLARSTVAISGHMTWRLFSVNLAGFSFPTGSPVADVPNN